MSHRLLPVALAAALALVGSLASAGEASAETCSNIGGSNDWNSGLSWDCGHVPGPGDSALVGSGDDPGVATTPIASPGSLGIGGNGRIRFSNEANLSVGSMSALAGSIEGAGSLTVNGNFSKGSTGHFFILDSVDVLLNGDSAMDAGAISVCQAGDPPSDPTLHINADFTIAGASFSHFNCSSSGARIRVGPTGHLVKAVGGLTRFETAIDNDGTITAQAGTLELNGGTANALGSTSDGDYLADSGATLEFRGSPPVIGAAGRLGGAGTIHVNTIDMDMASGSVLDPAVLQHSGFIRLRGTAPVTLADLELTGGEIDSDRPVAVDEMNVTAGALQRDFTLTVQPGGSFTKTGFGTLFIRNSGDFGSADLVLNADASLDGGSMCVARSGSENPDRPNLHINQDFTIGSAAPSSLFQCGPQFGNSIHVNGADGHLSKVGSGTTNFNDLDVAGGTLSVATGQTFVFANTYAQSAGVTEIASGGTLQAAPTLTGGVLRGAGQVTGNLTNSAGTVRPGSSPGSLAVSGNYTQGASGTLAVDVNGTTPGTQYDRLSVGGAASLHGTLAVVKGAGFAPQPADAFQFLTSASRTGTFASLRGERLPDGNSYSLDYPGAPDFGARLLVTGPSDFVVTDCDDPDLATVTAISGDLVANNVPDCDALEFPNLTEVGGTIGLSGNTAASVVDLSSLTEAAAVDVSDNGDAEVKLGALETVDGDLSVESRGTGDFDPGDASAGGDTNIRTEGYTSLSGTTAGAGTAVENSRPEALLRTELLSGAFVTPVDFTLTRLDPASLPPQDGTAAGGGPAVVDPVAAYQFDFEVPTLNQDARLTFEVQVGALDPATRSEFLAAVEAGRATLATKGDAAGGTYRAFPLCAGAAAPTADGCVRVEKLDANGQPTTGAPAVVRFSGVAGHFSTWAVATVASTPAPQAGTGGTGGGGGGPIGFSSRTLVTLELATKRIPARGPVKVRVKNANGFAIAGRLAGETVKRVTVEPRRRVKLPARAFRAGARTRKTVALGLPRKLRNLLRSNGRLALRITANVTDPAGQRRVVKRRLTPKLRTR